MGTVTLQGNVTVGPTSCNDACAPPAGTISFTLRTSPSPKPYGLAYYGAPTIASPSAYLVLPGATGTSPGITRIDFLHIRVQSTMKLRLTMVDPEGGSDIVSIVNIAGEFLMEFPSAGTCKLVEVKGQGTVEYVVSGAA